MPTLLAVERFLPPYRSDQQPPPRWLPTSLTESRNPDPSLRRCPARTALLLALAFRSRTCQRGDRGPTNGGASAMFGDGGAAAALVGRGRPRAKRPALGQIPGPESVFSPGATLLMGFRLRN